MASRDPSINLSEKFGVKEDWTTTRPGKAFTNQAERIDALDPSSGYLMKHMYEFDLYQIILDDYNCSGMCTPGLFYFTNSITFGPPKQTCLTKFMHVIHNDARGFANT